MLKLYYAPGTISIAVAITLEEAGLPYETVKVDFKSAQQRLPDYLSINAKGRVPALILQDGTVLTETGALLEYIASISPAAQLIPADPTLAAHMRSAMFYLASTMHVAHAHKMRGSRWATQQSSFDDMAALVPQTMAACATYVETHLLRGTSVLTQGFSIADPYLFVVCNWLEGDGVHLSDYPKIQNFMTMMETRQSVKTIREKAML
ncbi:MULTISPECIES: glutathione S-transferase family protein [unclassified Sulfitobacter]|jgi:glutathione S-transferase|uniref:glutathione S-transferase family protein n=1 Tax=unclassified Sulfitobacter TaxID=196795 RepID=UPI001594671B|nr:glutathione S-transferase family protein [Sulfitobacter sp. HGT1]MBQ0804813.1 glutathione S-transferase family protein [Sulfitobacter sp.]